MKRAFCAFVLVILYNIASSKVVPEYAISLIPSALVSDAGAVMRSYNLSIKVKSPTEAFTKEQYVLTVLNERGAKFTALDETYDKFSSIRSIKAALYNKEGKQIREVKTSDFTDRSNYGNSFYDDNRVKELNFNYSVYPYTISFEVERKLSSLFFLPDWHAQPAKEMAVENSSFRIEYPESINVRYRAFHIAGDINKNTTAGTTVVSCAVSHIAAVRKDELAPKVGYDLPQVLIAADDIVIEQYTSKFDSWGNFGKFYYDLNMGRNVLPNVAKKTVHELTDSCSTALGKVKVLYQYLKNTTRYISIQLGIGGWQTLPAAFVAEKGYGDCKALTNYLMAMLQEAGVRSYPALVSAGDDHNLMLPDFVSNVFNHVILCVPLKNDTVWVECTAKTFPEGYLSSFTHNRNALLVLPDGGKMIKTPVYGTRENRLVRNVLYDLDTGNTLNAKVLLHCSGLFFEKEEDLLHEMNKPKVEKHLSSKFELPNHTISSYKLNVKSEKYVPFVEEEIALTGVPRLNVSGPRLFLVPFIMPMNLSFPVLPKERSDPFYIPSSFDMCDTITINIPGNYTTEYLPEDVRIEHQYGGYTCTYKLIDNRLIVIRNYRQTEGLYPASQYPDFFRLARTAIGGGEYEKIALIKKQ